MWQRLSGSETITVNTSSQNTIQLTAKDLPRHLSGTSENEVWQDQAGIEYFLKEAKPRKIETIFQKDPFYNQLKQRRLELLGDYVFNPYTEKPDNAETVAKVITLSSEDNIEYTLIQEHIGKYVTHVQDVMLTNTALEILASHISAAIMGDLLITPKNYFYLHQNTPVIISRTVGHLREFLSEHPILTMAKTSAHWLSEQAPSFADLGLVEQEAKILGQAYFVALLFGHNDLVNIINLSNCGYIQADDGILILSIVDWGNALGVGFNGLTSTEGAFINPQFDDQNETDCFLHCPIDIRGFKHLMPFDEVIYPLLPRQVIPDLFDLTKDDVPSLRQAQREGFYEACTRAVSTLGHVKELIQTIIQDTFQNIIILDDEALIKQLLPESIYPTCRKIDAKNSYNLPAIIEGRIKSLLHMKLALEDGKSLKDIAQERLSVFQKSQSTRFFAADKPTELTFSADKLSVFFTYT